MNLGFLFLLVSHIHDVDFLLIVVLAHIVDDSGEESVEICPESVPLFVHIHLELGNSAELWG